MPKEKIVESNSTPKELTNEEVEDVSGGLVLNMRGMEECIDNIPDSQPYAAIDEKRGRLLGYHSTKIGARLDALKNGASPSAYTYAEYWDKLLKEAAERRVEK